MSSTRSDGAQIPLLLIHGAWLSARSWEPFSDYFAARGFAVSAPEWPRKHGDVEELREHAEELAGLGLQEIVDHYDALIRAADERPVLIGHSFGGLVVEPAGLVVSQAASDQRGERDAAGLVERAPAGAAAKRAHSRQHQRQRRLGKRPGT